MVIEVVVTAGFVPGRVSSSETGGLSEASDETSERKARLEATQTEKCKTTKMCGMCRVQKTDLRAVLPPYR